ncbi:MAG: glutamine--tRNA ligase/YqeY domain fusion protein [Myxococcota bacterium]|nr:glutamine--tRNA ligase/YqeY domain fusion protein [Myxococcota bacterium]
MSRQSEPQANFIRAMIEEDLASGKHGGRVVTRFPPEPNGYLHIGHAKAICLNFGLAHDFDGTCHLRFDDTNPAKEDMEYVEAIQRDLRWLGFDWGENLFFASDYYEQLYDFARHLVEHGRAYVCSLSEEEIREYRGTVTDPGTPSPHRDRSVEENLDLFARMRAGEFEEGAHVLRARIDMASPNMKMRDPLLYRILQMPHYRTGETWCIYPFYDFAHCLSDAIEGITHSICTLEFENNRELYDWILDQVPLPCDPAPEQTEFARLSLGYCLMSKRRLLQLVEQDIVTGWDDPRMPTIAGMRRRGVTASAIRSFSERVGVAKANSTVDYALFEHAIRDDLNHQAPRVMGVLDPLRMVIDNYPEDGEEWLDAPLWPHDVPREGSRQVPFSREIWIERSDFMEEPPRKFFRLAPGREVRLRYGYLVTCTHVVKDPSGEVVEVHCDYDPETRGGNTPDGRKVKGTLHWVSARHALRAEMRLYDRLFAVEDPSSVPEGGEFFDNLNPGSLEVVSGWVESSLQTLAPGSHVQFERQGYFYSDPIDHGQTPVFNRTVTLKDSWARMQARTAPATRAKTKTKTKTRTSSSTEATPRTRVPTPGTSDPVLMARLERYQDELGLGADEARLLTTNVQRSDFFEAALGAHDNADRIAKWFVHVLLAELKDRTLDSLPFGGEAIGELVALLDDQTLSTRTARTVFEHLLEHGGKPRQIAAEHGLEQVTDTSAIAAALDQVAPRPGRRCNKARPGRV